MQILKGVFTMLKTNSKKAAENIRAYIVGGFSPEGYTEQQAEQLLTNLIYRELMKGAAKK